MTDEYSSATEIEDNDGYVTTRFLYGFWRLCEQRILDVTEFVVRYASKVTVERPGVPPEVRVAQLPGHT